MTGLYLLDTCIVSNFIRRNAPVKYPRFVQHVSGIVRAQGATISVVTRYELGRGLKDLARRGEGSRKIASALLFLQETTVLGLEDNGGRGWQLAEDLYVRAKALSPAVTFSEGDLLTAAAAVAHDRILLTADDGLGERLAQVGLAAFVEVCSLL